MRTLLAATSLVVLATHTMLAPAQEAFWNTTSTPPSKSTTPNSFNAQSLWNDSIPVTPGRPIVVKPTIQSNEFWQESPKPGSPTKANENLQTDFQLWQAVPSPASMPQTRPTIAVDNVFPRNEPATAKTNVKITADFLRLHKWNQIGPVSHNEVVSKTDGPNPNVGTTPNAVEPALDIFLPDNQPPLFESPSQSSQFSRSTIAIGRADNEAGYFTATNLDEEKKEDAKSTDSNSANITDSSKAAKTGKIKPPLLTTAQMTGPLSDTMVMFSNLSRQAKENALTQLPNFRESAVYTLDDDMRSPQWIPSSYTWISPTFYHKPLYFEQPNLERYGIGRSRCVQPIFSAAHFFGSIALVPYKTLTHHPCEKVYTLGNMRPGDCVPFQRGAIFGQSSVGELREFYRYGSGY